MTTIISGIVVIRFFLWLVWASLFLYSDDDESSHSKHSKQAFVRPVKSSERMVACVFHRRCALWFSATAAALLSAPVYGFSPTMTTKSPTKQISGIQEIVNQYDVFLLDMWGVMHDGHSPYDGVLEVVQRLREANKEMIILSNSSKRRDNSVKMLQKLGFDHTDFSKIITSGETAFELLASESSLEANLPTEKKVFILGSGDDDVEYCQSAGWQVVPLERASLIVARGTFTVNDGVQEIHKRVDAQAYQTALQDSLEQAAQRRLPMMVTNPDKVRPDAERPPMPGKIGDMYEKALAVAANSSTHGVNSGMDLVRRIGKPFPDVYNLALASCLGGQEVDRSRVCMVGDALETDVTGGVRAGIDTLWVLKDGIHSADLAEDMSLEEGAASILRKFNERKGTYAGDEQLQPTLIMPRFQWQ